MMEQPGIGQDAPTEDMNDPRFWDRVGSALYQGIKAAARLGRLAALVGAPDVPWPQFSENLHTFSAFREDCKKN